MHGRDTYVYPVDNTYTDTHTYNTYTDTHTYNTYTDHTHTQIDLHSHTTETYTADSYVHR